MTEKLKIVISGGGTGGHIFPAVSIANAIKEAQPTAEILFVGAEGRMEMQKVPAAGYAIEGLPIAGLDRKRVWKNVGVAWKYLRSLLLARKILKRFRPQAVVGVGGYASGATLKMASMMGIPTLLQEQNSYAGVTNKMLARGAQRICVAYDGMERYFPADKILITGNPVRQELLRSTRTQAEARAVFGLEAEKPTVLIIGGSLGARTINRAVLSSLEQIRNSGVQFIWQTGKLYIDEARRQVEQAGHLPMLHVTDFLTDMATAYKAADIVVSRAGASSISELSLLAKPTILVPSPNVAEDHQTKNAMALVEKGAAILVTDAQAATELISTAIQLVRDTAQLQTLSKNISQLAYADAANTIAQEVLRLAQAYKKTL